MSRRLAPVRKSSRSRQTPSRTIEVLEQRVLLSAGLTREASSAVAVLEVRLSNTPPDVAAPQSNTHATLSPAYRIGQFKLVPGGIRSNQLSRAEIATLLHFLESPAVPAFLKDQRRLGPVAKTVFGQPVVSSTGWCPDTRTGITTDGYGLWTRGDSITITPASVPG